MRPLKQCASSSQRVRFPHSEGKQTVVWMTRSEIPVAVRSLLPASPSEGSQRERAVEARSPPGSSPSLYWNPRGPKPANRGSRGKRLGSHRWCAAEPENWEGGWRSGLGNLSSFSINHQLAFAARPVTCSEKAAPSGFWKLGAKTNLARGLPEGLPHPLLTCCLCSFFFFFLLGGASSRVARLRPSPPRPTAQRRVQSLDRPPPSRRSSENSTASAWPRPIQRARPSAFGLGPSPAPSPAPRLCRNVAGLPAQPGSARLGLPPASGPVASGAVPLAPPRLRLPPKTLLVGSAPTVTLGMGPSLGLPHPTSSPRVLPG